MKFNVFKVLKYSIFTGAIVVTGFILYLYLDIKSVQSPEPAQVEIVLDDSMNWETLQIEAIQYLEDLIKIKTVRKDENKAAFYLQKIFIKEGIPSKIIPHPEYPNKVSLVAELGPEDSTEGVILLNHLDVVEADLAEWGEDPFSGDFKDGVIKGRGALDMKGMAVMELMAFLTLHRQQIPLKQKVMFLSVPDEENGGVLGAKFLLEEHTDLFEGYHYVLNEGGFGIQDFPHKGNKIFNIQTSEKGILGLEVKSHYPSGHGSMPDKKYSSIELMRFLLEVQKLQKFMLTEQMLAFFHHFSDFFEFPENFLLKRIQNPIVQLLIGPQIRANRTMNALVTNTISVTGLEVSNFGPNVIPAESSSYLDIRLLPGESPDHFENKIKKLAEKYNVEVTRKEAFPATESSLQTPLLEMFVSIISDNVPDSKQTPYMSPGATDSRYFRERGFESYGLIPILITMDELGTMHGKGEQISSDNIRLGIKILFETLVAYNQIEQDPL